MSSDKFLKNSPGEMRAFIDRCARRGWAARPSPQAVSTDGRRINLRCLNKHRGHK